MGECGDKPLYEGHQQAECPRCHQWGYKIGNYCPACMEDIRAGQYVRRTDPPDLRLPVACRGCGQVVRDPLYLDAKGVCYECRCAETADHRRHKTLVWQWGHADRPSDYTITVLARLLWFAAQGDGVWPTDYEQRRDVFRHIGLELAGADWTWHGSIPPEGRLGDLLGLWNRYMMGSLWYRALFYGLAPAALRQAMRREAQDFRAMGGTPPAKWIVPGWKESVTLPNGRRTTVRRLVSAMAYEITGNATVAGALLGVKGRAAAKGRRLFWLEDMGQAMPARRRKGSGHKRAGSSKRPVDEAAPLLESLWLGMHRSELLTRIMEARPGLTEKQRDRQARRIINATSDHRDIIGSGVAYAGGHHKPTRKELRLFGRILQGFDITPPWCLGTDMEPVEGPDQRIRDFLLMYGGGLGLDLGDDDNADAALVDIVASVYSGDLPRDRWRGGRTGVKSDRDDEGGEWL